MALITGFPFLFLLAYTLFCYFKGHRRNEIKKPLLLNVLLYPLLLFSVFLILIKLFGVDKEFQNEIQNITKASTDNILAGQSPTQNNPALAILFLGSIYSLGVLVPTFVIGFVYSIVSTVLLIKFATKRHWWSAYMIAILAVFACVAIGYVFRTPIFNWLT